MEEKCIFFAGKGHEKSRSSGEGGFYKIGWIRRMLSALPSASLLCSRCLRRICGCLELFSWIRSGRFWRFLLGVFRRGSRWLGLGLVQGRTDLSSGIQILLWKWRCLLVVAIFSFQSSLRDLYSCVEFLLEEFA